MIRGLADPVLRLMAQYRAELRGYRPAAFRGDLFAGITVAVVEVPQAMAYALIAGVPPQYGIYTSIVQGLLGALFSSNPNLSTGPTNTQSLLVAAAVKQVAAPDAPPEVYLQLVIALTLFKGLIQLLFAGARMGNLVRYVSRSVILGFTAGAGVLIAVGQAPAFLGIQTSPHTWLPGVLGAAQSWWPYLADVRPAVVAVGTLALAILILSRMISPLVPGALLAVLVPAAGVWLLGLDARGVGTIGPLPTGLPAPVNPWPGADVAETLVGGAFALALLGLIETVSIGKALAARDNRRIDPNREFLAQGLANTLGAFLQNIPGSGSFTRSALNRTAGGSTRVAGVISALGVAAIFLLFAPQARFVPLSALAAILFVVAAGLIDLPAIRRTFRAGRGDALVCGITFLAALLLPLAWAIYVGIFLNIALYLRSASRLHIAEMVGSPGGPFIERPIHQRGTEEHKVMFVQLEGDLFFGVADELEEQLTTLAHGRAQAVILRLKRTHSIDATVEAVLDRFVTQMQARGRHVLLCGVRPELMRSLHAYGLIDRIGRDRVFEATHGVFTSAKSALRRARELVGASLDADHVREIDEAETWGYDI